MSQGTGSDIKIWKRKIRNAIKNGAGFWGSLISLGSKLLPIVMPLAKKAIAPFIGTWENPIGMGVKKKRTAAAARENSPFNSIPVLGTIL